MFNGCRRSLLFAASLMLLVLSACSSTAAVDPIAQVEKPTRELRILQWEHFVPRYDEWFDAFAAEWGEKNGVKVVVDHVDVTELGGAIAAELEAGEGHDLFEHVVSPASFEADLMDLSELNAQARARYGRQVSLCTNSSYNPHTQVFYGFCHGWVPDPGDYRKTLWEIAGMEEGPNTWVELLDYGARIKSDLSVQLGIGLSKELDSNMATRALLWSYGASVQDENENVVINSPETVAAVEYMVELYENAMTSEVFGWEPASNNRALISAQASYILNSISAYRTAQKTIPQVAEDVYFTPALLGPYGQQYASAHVFNIYMIPKYSQQSDLAKQFILDFTDTYEQAVYNSELYNFPAFPSTAPKLFEDGGWLDNDPFGSKPSNKLAVLKDAETWSTNAGHPGPANAAIGEVFARSIVPDMFAKAARRETSPEEAVLWAESEINLIFDKWRKVGLVGGAD